MKVYNRGGQSWTINEVLTENVKFILRDERYLV